jgi:hypothetical protein
MRLKDYTPFGLPYLIVNTHWLGRIREAVGYFDIEAALCRHVAR